MNEYKLVRKDTKPPIILFPHKYHHLDGLMTIKYLDSVGIKNRSLLVLDRHTDDYISGDDLNEGNWISKLSPYFHEIVVVGCDSRLFDRKQRYKVPNLEVYSNHIGVKLPQDPLAVSIDLDVLSDVTLFPFTDFEAETLLVYPEDSTGTMKLDELKNFMLLVSHRREIVYVGINGLSSKSTRTISVSKELVEHLYQIL